MVLPAQPTPNNGGEYESGYLREQSIILGDTLHFTDQWAVQGVMSTSFMNAESYAANGQVTSANSSNGKVSPTVSLIYTPIPRLMTYVTYARAWKKVMRRRPVPPMCNQFHGTVPGPASMKAASNMPFRTGCC